MGVFPTAGGVQLPQRLNKLLKGTGNGRLLLGSKRGVKSLPVNGGRLGRRLLPQGPCCQQGLAALMGVNEMMEGPELAGLPGLVPMVGGEDVVSTNVTCAAERLWASLKAARCTGDTAESGQSCRGIPEGCQQSPSLQFHCQLNIHLGNRRKL